MSFHTKKPDVSIVLPTYNSGEYIDRCLESCVNQSHRNIEIIIVDDCGIDDSIEKARLWASKDPRINIIHNPRNLGTYHARRRGVESSSGEYIIFLDPDDALDLGASQEIFAATRTNAPDIIFFGTTEIQKTNSGKIKTKKQRPLILKNNPKEHFARYKPTYLGTPGKSYKRSKLQDALSSAAIPCEERLVYGEDILILFLALNKSSSGLSIKKYLYLYHINKNSITNKRSITDIRFQQQQLDQIIAHFNKPTPHKNQETDEKSRLILSYFSAKLRSDKHMLARHTPNESGKDKYLKLITCAFLELPTIKGFIRILLHISSMGKIRF